MKIVYAWEARLRSTLNACSALALASVITLAHADQMSVEVMKARIEGAYELREFHRNGEILRPPLVDARVALLAGRIMFIAPNRAQESSKVTVAGYGTYSLEPGAFTYGWDGWTAVTQTTGGVSVSESLPWEGLRSFAATMEGGELRLRATNGPSEFRFSGDGLSFSDGKQTWLYHRVTER
jgi:hypothetical protein